jgi:two-component system, NtrC family, response regulator GlrR
VGSARILLINLEGPPRLLRSLAEILNASGEPTLQLATETISGASSCREGSLKVSLPEPDIICVVLGRFPVDRITRWFSRLRERFSPKPFLFLVDRAGPGEVLRLLDLGATDFMVPPLQRNDVLPRIWRLLKYSNGPSRLVRTLKEEVGLQQLVGESPSFMEEVRKIPLVAKCDAGILICGETGTGKELFARAIHYLSPRADKPFIPVNCGAIPIDLAEAELFGHERGAFTGAVASRPGLVQEADGGTMFLDEVDSLPLGVQVKLLRFLQEKEYRSVGSGKLRRADVRIIASSNGDLETAVNEGGVRQDLYYRLNIVSFRLPPLRERPEDVPLLARYFLAKYRDEFDKRITDFSADALRILVQYSWPGNVRELENVVERAVLFSDEALVRGSDLILPHSSRREGEESFQEAKARLVSQFEQSYINSLLLAYSGNISQAARAAKKNRRAFWELVRKYDIDVARFRPDQGLLRTT